MSMDARRELVRRFRTEYVTKDRAGKGNILDALCEATSWNRKYACEALKRLPTAKVRHKRSRKRVYGPNEEAALVKVWRLSGFLASKRLAPFLGEFLEALERHGELRLPEPTRSRLAGISASTIDRLLRRHHACRPRPACFTKPGSLIKKQVAVRTGMGWDDARPGYCEVDTVAHCGESYEGEFFWTLTVTDVATGWTENAVLKNRAQRETLDALQGVRSRLPFPLLGVDTDNGTEFLNWHLVNFCKREGIQFTRCRPYHKNDQCRVEQKNGALVRRHAGYDRYDTAKQYRLLARMYGLLRLLVNFFEPSLKGKEAAMTPYRRLLQTDSLKGEARSELEAVYLSLNPVKLREELQRTKMGLRDMESLVSFLDDATMPTRSGS